MVKGERVLVADQSETALLLESPSTFHGMLRDVLKKTEEALSTSVKDREEKRIKMEELPLQKAREAAQFVADNYDLLVIEPGLRAASFRFDGPEGTPSQRRPAPRQVVEREPPSAAEKARLADDTSRQIGTRDAFYGDLVPFLAALRENHSVPISFATVFGQKCTDPEPRGRAKEDRVRSALDDLVARLRAERKGAAVTDEDDIDILIAWRCSKAHLSNYSAEKAQEALRGLSLPSASESERALSGGVHALAVKLVEEGPAGPVRRAAEWSPLFAEDGLYLQAAVARHREAFEFIGAPRTLVIGADHAHKLAARLAGFDYIEEKYLAFGALAAEGGQAGRARGARGGGGLRLVLCCVIIIVPLDDLAEALHEALRRGIRGARPREVVVDVLRDGHPRPAEERPHDYPLSRVGKRQPLRRRSGASLAREILLRGTSIAPDHVAIRVAAEACEPEVIRLQDAMVLVGKRRHRAHAVVDDSRIEDVLDRLGVAPQS